MGPQPVDRRPPHPQHPPGAGADGRVLVEPAARPAGPRRPPRSTGCPTTGDPEVRAHAPSRTCCCTPPCTRRWAFPRQRAPPPRTRPTRTSAASCSSCTPSASTPATPRTDVKASSRMLTGYRVDVWWPRFERLLRPAAHATGPVRCSGSATPTPPPTAAPPPRRYLSYLARHPATARRIARRLCVRVRQRPPVGRAGRRGRPGLHATTAPPSSRPCCALVDHPEFAAVGRQRRSARPTEDYVATVRALRHPAAGARSTATRSSTRCTGSTARPARRRTSGRRRTASPRSTAPGPAPAGCSPASRCTATWPRGGGPPRRRPFPTYAVAAAPAAGHPRARHRPRRAAGCSASGRRAAVRRGIAAAAGHAAVPPADQGTRRWSTGRLRGSSPPSSTPRPTCTAGGARPMTHDTSPSRCGCPDSHPASPTPRSWPPPRPAPARSPPASCSATPSGRSRTAPRPAATSSSC